MLRSTHTNIYRRFSLFRSQRIISCYFCSSVLVSSFADYFAICTYITHVWGANSLPPSYTSSSQSAAAGSTYLLHVCGCMRVNVKHSSSNRATQRKHHSAVHWQTLSTRLVYNSLRIAQREL